MSNTKKLTINSILQIILLIVLLGVDRFTKFLAVSNLKGQESIVLIKDVLELKYLENTGAAFGIFRNMQWLFYIITAVVLIAICFLWVRVVLSSNNYVKTKTDGFKKKTFDHAILFNYILAILAAGAIGNLIDRIQHSYVVDFIYIKLIDFPIFNFADLCVSGSAVLIVIFFIFIYKEDKDLPIFSRKEK